MIKYLLLLLCILLSLGHSKGLRGKIFALRSNIRERIQMASCVDPLMQDEYSILSQDLLSKVRDGSQHWVGIAGGPGSGKSTLSAAVAAKINAALNEEIAVVLPMDGFHYSRAQLRQIAESSSGKYTFDELIARRGSPWTFDASAIVSSLSSAKTTGNAVLPTYSRQLSDPVPGGVELKRHHKIVICEGNYLFNFDDPLWSGLKSVFDEKWFISCADREQQRQRLIRRHLETWTDEKAKMWGMGVDGAALKADSNDVLNAQFVEETSKKWADRVIVSR